MNLATAETLLVVLIVGAMTVLAGRRLWRMRGGKAKTCGCCKAPCGRQGSPTAPPS